jgi:hypothetical protein
MTLTWITAGRPASSISSGSDFVPSIGLASFRPPHQRQRSSHETKAEPPCEQSVGPSVHLQSYPGNGGKYQGGNPCDDGENDEYAGDQWLNLCSMRACRRGSPWSGSDRPDLHRIGEVSLPDIIRACSGSVIAGPPQLGRVHSIMKKMLACAENAFHTHWLLTSETHVSCSL